MPTTEQLRLRALRLLNDQHQHSPQVIDWAKQLTALEVPSPRQMEAMVMAGFTPRELSLGAARW